MDSMGRIDRPLPRLDDYSMSWILRMFKIRKHAIWLHGYRIALTERMGWEARGV